MRGVFIVFFFKKDTSESLLTFFFAVYNLILTFAA